jgi:hypothetical protein
MESDHDLWREMMLVVSDQKEGVVKVDCAKTRNQVLRWVFIIGLELRNGEEKVVHTSMNRVI